MAAAVFVVPDAALAAGNNSISGTTNTNGTARQGALRHKTDTSAIKVNLQNNISDGLCLEFRNASTGATIGKEVCWYRGETGAHIIANSAGKQDFYIVFWPEDYTTGNRDRDFSGIAYY
ncbi:hypothetical protein ADL15_39815 [Actinoplanes awajinensis subsp. mycoplanecinus]|uniref:Uncharacterized protein n=2 Tax=Actinoplanes awajinensis TaxID=135946 RepID=A0A124G8G6_9ACTN|nr:hypothetical protein ADL15_39815 [Actinoplanes awajinensis subsp. mycoplanecinus]